MTLEWDFFVNSIGTHAAETCARSGRSGLYRSGLMNRHLLLVIASQGLGNEIANDFGAVPFLTVRRFIGTHGNTALNEHAAAFC